eukprot:Filipodium_phascolosomae@DN2546_c0_g1_i1.p1
MKVAQNFNKMVSSTSFQESDYLAEIYDDLSITKVEACLSTDTANVLTSQMLMRFKALEDKHNQQLKDVKDKHSGEIKVVEQKLKRLQSAFLDSAVIKKDSSLVASMMQDGLCIRTTKDAHDPPQDRSSVIIHNLRVYFGYWLRVWYYGTVCWLLNSFYGLCDFFSGENILNFIGRLLCGEAEEEDILFGCGLTVLTLLAVGLITVFYELLHYFFSTQIISYSHPCFSILFRLTVCNYFLF